MQVINVIGIYNVMPVRMGVMVVKAVIMVFTCDSLIEILDKLLILKKT